MAHVRHIRQQKGRGTLPLEHTNLIQHFTWSGCGDRTRVPSHVIPLSTAEQTAAFFTSCTRDTFPWTPRSLQKACRYHISYPAILLFSYSPDLDTDKQTNGNFAVTYLGYFASFRPTLTEAFGILFYKYFKRLFLFLLPHSCVFCARSSWWKVKNKNRLKLLQNKIPNAPIRVGLTNRASQQKSDALDKEKREHDVERSKCHRRIP